MLYYKLNAEEVSRVFAHMFGDSISTRTRASLYMDIARSRKPDTMLPEQVVNASRVYLNKAKTIWMQVVHFYGGEHFNEPHYFLGEICHTTTNSAFSYFVNRFPVNIRKKLPFTY